MRQRRAIVMSDERRPLKEHVSELSARLKRCVFYFLVACAIGYTLNAQLVDWIMGPLKELLPADASIVYTKPFEKIWVYIRVSLYFGFLFAAPFVLLEGFQFANPAFDRFQKGRFLVLLLASSIAFAGGIWVGINYALPAVLNAVFQFGSQEIAPFLTVSSYVNSAAAILLACALFFEIPVLMFFLAQWGFVGAALWRRGRRLAIVVNSILAAFLSPPDPVSMLVLMLPLLLLYEGGIVLASLGERLRSEEDRKEEKWA